MSTNCFTFNFEIGEKKIIVTLAYSEPLNSSQIESLSKSPHRERRSWAMHLIHMLKPGLSEYFQFKNLNELQHNHFNKILAEEGWNEGLCTSIYTETEILLWIHQTFK